MISDQLLSCLVVSPQTEQAGWEQQVPLIWVPGLEGNEKADQLATKRAETPFVEPESACAPGKAYFKQELKKVMEATPRHWHNLPGHQHAKGMLGDPNRKSSEFWGPHKIEQE